jgi:hypothetical protein
MNARRSRRWSLISGCVLAGAGILVAQGQGSGSQQQPTQSATQTGNVAAGSGPNGAVVGGLDNAATDAYSQWQRQQGQKEVQRLIDRNPQLDTQFEKVLSTDTVRNVKNAASPYSDPKEFLTAIHLFDNLGLMKAGVPWPKFTAVAMKEGLGTAVKRLRPNVNAKEEMKKAKDQAKSDWKSAKH